MSIPEQAAYFNWIGASDPCYARGIMFRSFIKDLILVEFYAIPKVTSLLLFFGGFTLLVVQIVGIRVLGPYVGTAIPVWATVIGVMLGGGAIGYYIGGYYADRHESIRVLRIIVGLSVISIMAIPALRHSIPDVQQIFPPTFALLVSAKILFMLPAITLSALITYVIRAYVQTVERIGQVHGDLYTVATVGSIAGVFVTSYVLIPYFTVPHILYGVALLVGMVGFFERGSKN